MGRRTSFTTQAGVLHSPKFNLKIHTSTEKSPRPWFAQKVFAPDSLSTPVKKPPSVLVTSCQSDKCQKVPSSANWKKNLVIEVRSPKLLVVTAPLSPTTPTPSYAWTRRRWWTKLLAKGSRCRQKSSRAST